MTFPQPTVIDSTCVTAYTSCLIHPQQQEAHQQPPTQYQALLQPQHQQPRQLHPAQQLQPAQQPHLALQHQHQVMITVGFNVRRNFFYFNSIRSETSNFEQNIPLFFLLEGRLELIKLHILRALPWLYRACTECFIHQ